MLYTNGNFTHSGGDAFRDQLYAVQEGLSKSDIVIVMGVLNFKGGSGNISRGHVI